MTNTLPAPAVRDWLRTNAHPLTPTDADPGPLTDSLAAATVVGLGESTRFSVQTYGVAEGIFRGLVRRHGFRTLALQDGARSGDRMNRYVLGGDGTAEEALAGAWRPLRTRELADTLDWIRGFNAAHPDDPVQVFGVQAPHAEESDYDAVLSYAQAEAPEHLAALTTHLETIRTAHRVDEHVQRHNGVHPGRPFAEHARDALALLETLPATPSQASALDHARLILDFHENSVAGRGSFARDDEEETAANRIADHRRRTGAKIVYRDGIAHTAAVDMGYGDALFRSPGSRLRAALGTGYASVAIGFHHGDLDITVVPEPGADHVDALLGTIDAPAHYVDLRSPAPESVRAWLDGPGKFRVISGVYDPAEDHKAHLDVPAIAAAFDVLVHIREATPLRWLD
ncbi:erythromycin esterase family protein [Nocardia sp. NPDC050406]|uniref:erythromycin esterase family protein n=1 Tax=Nocardia sp. NPDC050406 TaxID=3364318 RepID=UPI0037AAD53A